MFLQIVYSLSESITPITAIATIFSILSITLSVFEHISSSLLLKTETILVIKMDINSREFQHIEPRKLKKLQNLRFGLCAEISKIIRIDEQLIELLRPTPTLEGIYFTFYIRSDASKSSEMLKLIKDEAKSGRLANVKLKFINCLLFLFKVWFIACFT